jgi:hypothetical protein
VLRVNAEPFCEPRASGDGRCKTNKSARHARSFTGVKHATIRDSPILVMRSVILANSRSFSVSAR